MSTTSWRETIKSNKFWHTLYAQFQSWPWTKLDFPWKAEAEPDMAASLVGPTKCQRQCHWKAHGCRGCTAALKRCPQEPPLWACRPRGVPETLRKIQSLRSSFLIRRVDAQTFGYQSSRMGGTNQFTTVWLGNMYQADAESRVCRKTGVARHGSTKFDELSVFSSQNCNLLHFQSTVIRTACRIMGKDPYQGPCSRMLQACPKGTTSWLSRHRNVL